MTIEDLKRKLQTDPSNLGLQADLIKARARIEGSNAFIDFLSDRLLWNSLTEDDQDLAIEAAQEQLGEAFAFLETQCFSAGDQSHRIAVFEHSETEIEFHLLPGGSFLMGCSDFSNDLELSTAAGVRCEVDWAEEAIDLRTERFYGLETFRILQELPAHTVRVRPMLVARYPTTIEQFFFDDYDEEATELVGTHKSFDHPIVNIPWSSAGSRSVDYSFLIGAQEYCEKIGDGLRLPSEAEWEYACRAGTTTRYFWGDDMDHRYCWHQSQDHLDVLPFQTHECFEHDDYPNAFGLIDMLGNVWEWCQDHWYANYDGALNCHRARGQSEALSEEQSAEPGKRIFARVLRGGSVETHAGRARCSARRKESYWDGQPYAGFRLFRSIDLSENFDL